MKKVVIAIVVLLLLCCCCTIIAGALLFTSPSGYVEFNGQCLHRGAQSDPKTGPCSVQVEPTPTPNPTPNPAPTPNPQSGNLKQYNGKNSDEYTFSYPSSFVLDDSGSIIYVYSKDPKTNTVGNFNDNLNITTAADAITINQNNCDDYADELIGSIAATLNVDESSVATNIQTINGLKVCVVSWDAELDDIGFSQQQYVFSDFVLDTNFILTVSTKTGSTNLGAFADIVDSFETK